MADWLDRYRTFREAGFQRLDTLLDELKASMPDQNRERWRPGCHGIVSDPIA